ncbi:MAG: RlmE family RNA methyltransferase [Asgard group archaeon]|nr:RlmE family RNA methyltransferase [Asgard group archaeon]
MSHRERMRKREYYYRKAKTDGFRSRASYKLKQIDNKFSIFKKGYSVLDIGAAPGGWSQVAANYVGYRGIVYAVDLEYMEPIENVQIIKGDITKEKTKERLQTIIGEPVDVVLCDISPKVSGNWSTDHARQIYLAENALKIALADILKQGGKFVCKLFQGDLFDAYMDNVKKLFQSVYLFKPKASRKSSAEIYVIAKGLIKGPLQSKNKKK